MYILTFLVAIIALTMSRVVAPNSGIYAMNQEATAKRPASDRNLIATQAETAEYIGELNGQLEKLARTHGLVDLQFHLMTCREAAEKAARP